MKLTTDVALVSAPFSFSCEESFVSIGSCFSQNIGDALNRHKIAGLTNPFGVLYDPISVFRVLELALDHNIEDLKRSIFEYQGYCHSWYTGQSFSDTSPEGVMLKLTTAIDSCREYLNSSRLLILTFGTASVYHHDELHIDVANCHKVPQTSFTRRYYRPTEFTDKYFKVFFKLKKLNPDLKIVFTLSPVRHIRDGLDTNSYSKAMLRVFCEEICSKVEDHYYFPSYEIMIDELRDYRFYEPDMIHPSMLAIQEIFRKFLHQIMSSEEIKMVDRTAGILRDLNHRERFPESESSKKFKQSVLKKINLQPTWQNWSVEIKKLEV